MGKLGVGTSTVGADRSRSRWYWKASIALLTLFASASAFAQCVRTLTADVVAFDTPLMYNRLGASNINGMMYALRRDTVYVDPRPDPTKPLDSDHLKPLSHASFGKPDSMLPGNVALRPDKRPRPLVLRIAAGDCLQVKITNLLTPAPNPFKTPIKGEPPFTCATSKPEDPAQCIDEQVADRFVGFHVSGMQVVNGVKSDALSEAGDDSSYAGSNKNSLVPQGQSRTYTLFGEKEGVFLVQSLGSTIGGDANQGNTTNGLFGQVIVQPKGARIWRSILTEEEMRLAADANRNGALDASERLPSGQPKINYGALYPNVEPWIAEGKAGLPIIDSIQGNKIVHSEIEMMVVGPDADGSWTSKCPGTDCPYPLESKGRRNPSLPNRLEPFRDLAQVWHDEPSTTQAFPGFYNHPVFKYVLAGVKDGFMINYGSGGIGSEIIANRLGVGPMHDCLACAYEEFFLTSYTVGDPAVLVDTPANVGLETLLPGETPDPAAVGPKANFALYPADPMNVHHGYVGDFIKFRNTHIGKEQHVFHLHNHQWLYNPNDDNANYLDAQGIGPGVGYTYEINFGGAGNRNKSAGDAIFHCHFYPHFAQGMWYHQRNYDVFEEGTRLAVSGAGYHTTPWALKQGTPASGARALPDGEMVAGVPLVAILPLPGKALPPMPGKVEIIPNPTKIAVGPKAGRPVGSVAKVDRTDVISTDPKSPDFNKLKNPGYPFWVAGIDVGPNFDPADPMTNMSIVGQRPPTPVLDMIRPELVDALKVEDATLFATLKREQADGWDGGLPRHALRGYAAGGATLANVVSARDFTKIIEVAGPVFYPEGGTDVEHAAMRFHKKGQHPTKALNADGTTKDTFFVTNGVGPVVGAPFHEPCRDDTGKQMGRDGGNFFSGGPGSYGAATSYALEPTHKAVTGRSAFNADSPRIYKGVNIQFDAILNKVGYHFPQQRIITLWEDAWPVISQAQPPEPLVMRLNTFDCAVFSHSNLVPEYYEMDDYQVRTPTDIIGQHIHLPKWDLTTTDGAANGWNYEDGTLAPGAIRERIHAINRWNDERACHGETPVLPGAWAELGYGGKRTHDVTVTCPTGSKVATATVPHLKDDTPHPYFGQFGRQDWLAARTTLQRWFADPVVNTDGVDRGLGIIFTHDHYGPSTHQQIGLYATVLAQPAGSTWMHNEKEIQLGAGPDGTGGRMDGGPTSWQARIIPPSADPAGVNVKANEVTPFREFYFEFADFQHAYEKGVYVGADNRGVPITPYVPPPAAFDPIAWVPNATNVSGLPAGKTIADAFRWAINPPARYQKNPVYPDLVIEHVNCLETALAGIYVRPCPQAIDVQDPGMFAVNYRNEPIALRIFDPDKTIPNKANKTCTKGSADRTVCGMQADGIEGDLAFAMATYLKDKTGGWLPSNSTTPQPIVRKIPELNQLEQDLMPWGTNTLNSADAKHAGDPFTPMVRTYMGDTIRVKIQAGGHEEEHNASISGMKWLQGGSGFGRQPNSGWRSSQAAGISEQFTLAIPVVPPGRTPTGVGTIRHRDYLYNVDSSMDGWFSGTWGIIRAYVDLQPDLAWLPGNNDPKTAKKIENPTDFVGVCPTTAKPRSVTIVAILANDLLPGAGVTISPAGSQFQHVGAPLTGAGTLVYNPRTTLVGGKDAGEDAPQLAKLTHQGPLHDPTAMLWVRLEDLEPDASKGAQFNRKTGAWGGACSGSDGTPGVANPNCPVKLKAGYKAEPLIVRGNAGECVTTTVYNRIPEVAPDLPTLATLIGVVKRDRNQLDGAVPFDVNLIRPSSHVGVSPQLIALDPFMDLGVNLGQNIVQTAPPATNECTTSRKGGTTCKLKSGQIEYQWYLGDLDFPVGNRGGVIAAAAPVEFGGFGLSPADKVKQGQKSMMGGMVVLPQAATFTEDAGQHAQATVTNGATTYRDFMVVMAKNLNHRYAGGEAVEHMNGEGFGIPEDSQESSNMALNYGIEPLWFRFGILPQAPFGGAGCGPGCYGGVPNAHEAFSNALAGGLDPATPVLTAKAGQEVRVHTAVPHGTSRGTTLTFHGHVWQRDPYVCPGDKRNDLDGACKMDPKNVASSAIGDNPYGFAQGAQESITPYSHFTFRFPKAGGANAKTGDFLFRDVGSFGNASGLWGLLRVEP